MSHFRSFTGAEPAGTIVVKVVDDGGETRAYIRQVSDPHDMAENSIEQSEEMPVDEALALARNKAKNIEGEVEIVVDLSPDAKWDERWGRLS